MKAAAITAGDNQDFADMDALTCPICAQRASPPNRIAAVWNDRSPTTREEK
jgi:hypothetical protein